MVQVAPFCPANRAHRLLPVGARPALARCRQVRGRPATTQCATWEQQVQPTVESSEIDLWQRLCLLQRQVSVAVADERYELAGRLRDERSSLVERLPLNVRLQLDQTEVLQDAKSSTMQKREAVEALRSCGTVFSVPTLAGCLHDHALQEAAAGAMWETWMRHPDPGVRQLMSEGLRALEAGGEAAFDHAERIFTRMIEADPTFAEGWNKRATVRFLQGKFGDSIADCYEVLARQPYHFGAWSGLGFSHVKLRNLPAALKAFESALQVHPGLPGIAQYTRALRDGLGGDNRPASID